MCLSCRKCANLCGIPGFLENVLNSLLVHIDSPCNSGASDVAGGEKEHSEGDERLG